MNGKKELFDLELVLIFRYLCGSEISRVAAKAKVRMP